MQLELKRLQARGRHHLRVRHPRPARGPDHVRPHRRDAGGERAAGRHAREIYDRPAAASSPTSSARPTSWTRPGSAPRAFRLAIRRRAGRAEEARRRRGRDGRDGPSARARAPGGERPPGASSKRSMSAADTIYHACWRAACGSACASRTATAARPRRARGRRRRRRHAAGGRPGAGAVTAGLRRAGLLAPSLADRRAVPGGCRSGSWPSFRRSSAGQHGDGDLEPAHLRRLCPVPVRARPDGPPASQHRLSAHLWPVDPARGA